jgi:Fe-S-cluster containining protein
MHSYKIGELPLESRMELVNRGDRWQCIKCGKCCTAVFKSDWLDPMLEHFGYLVDAHCPWYIPETKLCAHYSKRPLICRAYPFTLSTYGTGKFRLYRHSMCSGFGQGPILNIKSKIIEMVKYHELKYNVKYRIKWDGFDAELCVKIYRVRPNGTTEDLGV